MKPLVLWCRWHDARLRIHGRSAEVVWGELALPGRVVPFHFHLPTAELTLREGEMARTIRLDEMGVEIS